VPESPLAEESIFPDPDWPYPELQRLASQLGAQEAVVYDGFADFYLENDVNVIANLRSAGDELRVRFYLPPFEEDFEDDACDWAEAQHAPPGVELEVAEQDGYWTPRVVVNRPLQHDWATDPVRTHVAALVDSWTQRPPAASRAGDSMNIQLDFDPIAIDPASAWLLFSGEESIPTPAELRDSRRRNERGEFDFAWTAAKHVEPGDLILVYVMSPVLAVTHVARAATRGVLGAAYQGGGRRKDRGRKEYWTHISAPVEIEPIPLAELRAAAGGHLNLRGNAQFLRPEWIEKLTITAADQRDDDVLARVVQAPVGLASLPAPRATSFDAWKDIAAGALFNERLVERHIVEPLLRFVGADSAFHAQFGIGRRRADYVLMEDGTPFCVVEVKLAIREAQSGLWVDSPDFQQVRWYADSLGVGAILMDAYRILLIARHAEEPYAVIRRRTATEGDIETIRAHLRA
jgi:hypothetical protein